MAARLLALQLLCAVLSILLSCSITVASVDDTVLEDDEDLMISASFTLQFRAAGSCSTLYYNNIVAFSNVLRQAIASDINTDCDSCGFSENNFANEIMSCADADSGVTITFQATITDWESVDHPSGDILDSIERRYANSTTPVVISASEFAPGSVEGTELPLDVISVETSFVVTGSGDGVDLTGTDDTMDGNTTEVDPGNNNIVKEGSEKLRVTFGVISILSLLSIALQELLH